MTISNAFTVRIVANTTLGTAVAATSPGTFSATLSVPSLATPVVRLDPINATDYVDCAGGTAALGYTNSRAWIWASRGVFDTTTRKALMVCSPHSSLDYGYRTMLSSYDEGDNTFRVYESPFSVDDLTWPRSVGHMFDNQCIAGRTLYKMTAPKYIAGTGYVQPQIAKIDLDQITDDLTSAREGQAYLGSLNAPWEWDEDALTWVNPGRNLTAGALEYLPGCASLMFFHKKYLSFAPTATEVWTQPEELPITGMVDATDGRTKWAFHNLACYNPNSGVAVCGGGAYNPDGASNHRYSLQWFSVDGTSQVVTELDQSPVIMSVSETDMPTTEPAHLREAKCAMTYDPNSNEFLFFHDNLNIYGLDPGRPPGYQWRVVGTMTSEVDWVCAVPDYGVVLCFLSAANGGASVRVYKPASVPDVTPPSIPLNLTATAVSSTAIDLSWTASSDQNVQGAPTSGLAGYRLYRDGVLLSPGPVGLVTTYADTGLSAGTTYSYTVAAVDAAGNVSAQSAADTATTDAATYPPYSPTTWGGIILTQAQHEAAIPGTNNPHFERTWLSTGAWNGEGCMRWRVAYTAGEDADGYGLFHPGTTTRSVFMSFVARIGSTWWQHHASADRFKFVMFYPAAQTNPRPTIFNMPIFAGDGGAYSYRTWGPDLEAGGAGVDEFGTGAFDWNDNYPNHQYKESSVATGWYFYVMALEGNYTKVYLWDRSGPIIGSEAAALGQTFYARSREATGSILTSWNAQTWTNPRLLAYIEATTAGDANSYMDISHIRITQTLPSPPSGFVTG